MPRARTSRNNSKTASSEISLVPEAKRNVAPFNMEEEIRRRAYELYEQRGRIPGYEHDDWLTAEREVLARYQAHSA